MELMTTGSGDIGDQMGYSTTFKKIQFDLSLNLPTFSKVFDICLLRDCDYILNVYLEFRSTEKLSFVWNSEAITLLIQIQK